MDITPISDSTKEAIMKNRLFVIILLIATALTGTLSSCQNNVPAKRKAVELSEYRHSDLQTADSSSVEVMQIMNDLHKAETYKKEKVPDKTETVFGKKYSLRYEWTQNIFKRGHGADMYLNKTEGAFVALWFDEVT